ncbi:hypothetical protein WG947_14345 [Pontibacter sp. H259]|uniref:hypothetical protein n=1 Tax=Pontibacter sp. H259 TaxID=3133421 RepID=UPI0030BE43ED
MNYNTAHKTSYTWRWYVAIDSQLARVSKLDVVTGQVYTRGYTIKAGCFAEVKLPAFVFGADFILYTSRAG